MTTTAKAPTVETAQATLRFLWLDLTRKCQLECLHCYNASGPDGTHGAMSRENWISVLDQAAEAGVHGVQFIGGEPTMHPHAPELVAHALKIGLKAEVFSNLVRVTAEWWELLQRDGVTLATSYYSDQAEEHNAMTGRPSHGRSRENIAEAVRLGIPLRVGIIVGSNDQHVGEARRDLEALGVTRIGVDHVRPFGRGAHDQAPDTAALCGQCGSGRAAIGPNGDVSPCVFSDWMGVGNIHDAPLASILSGDAMTQANAIIRSTSRMDGCEPGCEPNSACNPGTPPSDCNPRR